VNKLLPWVVGCVSGSYTIIIIVAILIVNSTIIIKTIIMLPSTSQLQSVYFQWVWCHSCQVAELPPRAP
jgi:hypothetical protein